MRKKLVSLALAAAIMASVSVPAFATNKFDMGVFDGRQDVRLVTDEMYGITTVYPVYDNFPNAVSRSGDSFIILNNALSILDPFDLYFFGFDCYEPSYSGINSIIFRIGDDRYTFSNCTVSANALKNGFHESIAFSLKKETVSFMEDLSNHRDEEIKVRLVGDYQSFDFSLTDDMKNEIFTLYDLYDNGNGTRKSNLSQITNSEQTTVSKNGQVIDGHIAQKAADAVFGAFESVRRQEVIDAIIDSAH